MIDLPSWRRWVSLFQIASATNRASTIRIGHWPDHRKGVWSRETTGFRADRSRTCMELAAHHVGTIAAFIAKPFRLAEACGARRASACLPSVARAFFPFRHQKKTNVSAVGKTVVIGACTVQE